MKSQSRDTILTLIKLINYSQAQVAQQEKLDLATKLLIIRDEIGEDIVSKISSQAVELMEARTTLAGQTDLIQIGKEGKEEEL